MKNKLPFIAVLATLLVPFVAPWEGACQSSIGGSATKGASFYASALPRLDWELSDLDVRDAQNRPIRNAQSSQNLTALFMGNLFALAVLQDLRPVQQMWDELVIFSRLFRDAFFNISYMILGAVEALIAPSTKRFVHNVHNLWIQLSVGLFIACAMVVPIFARPASQHRILRC